MGPFSFRNLVIPYAKCTFSKTTSSRFGPENGTKMEPKITPFGTPFLIVFWIKFWTPKKLDSGPKMTPEKSGTFTERRSQIDTFDSFAARFSLNWESQFRSLLMIFLTFDSFAARFSLTIENQFCYF